jgi:uncharacterized protein with ParB-like and HNH nuclease domain/predicted transport protein
LLLEALARHLGDDEPVDLFSAKKIRKNYLTNEDEKGDRFFKLLLTENDRETLKALLTQRDPAEYKNSESVRVAENFNFFDAKIAKYPELIPALCVGLSKLTIVDISLDQTHDNPQLIFESMNSTGKALSQADLIRNFVLMGLDPDLQTELYRNYWRPMEISFGQQAYADQFDWFMRHYLTVKTGDIPRVGDIYEAFKIYASDKGPLSESSKGLLQEIQRFARYYGNVVLGHESDFELKQAFSEIINELKISATLPFLLALYEDYDSGALARGDFLSALRLTESYVFRRSIVEIPTNSLNKTYAEFMKHVDKARYLESIEAHYQLMPSYRRFPGDSEFVEKLKSKNLYNIYIRNYWLRRLENFGRKEPIAVENYTIEHLLPQNPNLSAEWQTDLGLDWADIQSKYLHTLGNLTLTAYNSEYSDYAFAKKRDMDGSGLRYSPLHLNTGLGQVEVWDETSIQDRASRLAELALRVWGKPSLAPEVLDQYQPREMSVRASYTYEDHEFLKREDVYGLFSSLKREILNLDPAVVEEVKKVYIAFKAESNFVDVVPQASGLRLTLNLTADELDDPDGLSRDLHGLGRPGNGETEVRVESFDDIPRAMGLIRQAFDKQMSPTEG